VTRRKKGNRARQCSGRIGQVEEVCVCDVVSARTIHHSSTGGLISLGRWGEIWLNSDAGSARVLTQGVGIRWSPLRLSFASPIVGSVRRDAAIATGNVATRKKKGYISKLKLDRLGRRTVNRQKLNGDIHGEFVLSFSLAMRSWSSRCKSFAENPRRVYSASFKVSTKDILSNAD